MQLELYHNASSNELRGIGTSGDRTVVIFTQIGNEPAKRLRVPVESAGDQPREVSRRVEDWLANGFESVGMGSHSDKDRRLHLRRRRALATEPDPYTLQTVLDKRSMIELDERLCAGGFRTIREESSLALHVMHASCEARLTLGAASPISFDELPWAIAVILLAGQANVPELRLFKHDSDDELEISLDSLMGEVDDPELRVTARRFAVDLEVLRFYKPARASRASQYAGLFG